ncbi:MAG: hypothetical protein WC659_03675 [Patescibacteria group bacterium]
MQPLTIQRPTLSSPPDLFKQAVELVLSQLKPYALIILVGLLPRVLLLLNVIIMVLHKGSAREEAIVNIILGIFGIVWLLLLVYLSILTSTAICLRMQSLPSESVRETFKRAQRYWWKVVGAGFLYGLLIVLLSLLLIVPGIIYWVYYSFALFVVVFENSGIRASLKRSKEIITGYWWAIFGRSLFVLVISVLIYVILSIPVKMFTGDKIFSAVWQNIIQIITSIITPVFIAYTYLQYKELNTIKGAPSNEVSK